MKSAPSSSLRSTIGPEGRLSAVAVASVIAFGSFNSASCASSIQRRNCPIGFGSQFTSSSAPRLYSSRRSSSDKETTDSVGGPAMALVWHPLFDWYTGGGMVYLLTTLHVLVCLFLIIVVLLQSGKAADLAGAFGGMGSQTVFGPRGTATVLSRATEVAAALFMITALVLVILDNNRAPSTGSVLERRHAAQQQTKPAQKAPNPTKK